VTLQLAQSGFPNGGSEILSFKLLRDDGGAPGDSGLIELVVADYDGQALQHQVSGLTGGAIYRFQYVAVNAYGESPGSLVLSAAASSLPAAPGSPAVDWARSGSNSLHLSWTEPAGGAPAAPILGYSLEVDPGNGTWTTVYDGSQRPSTLQRLVDGLVNGHLYAFRAVAVNYNGRSTPSATAAYYVCTEPAGFAAPTVEGQSVASMLLRWEPPAELGGCRVTGYAVYRDEGEVASAASGGGITVELNAAGDADVRGKPGLNSLLATFFPAGTAGQAFRLQVEVITTQRSSRSAVTLALLASVPGQPTDVPASDPAVTSAEAIGVTFAEPTPPASGGSPITSYEL
jgi:hypothetical protein